MIKRILFLLILFAGTAHAVSLRTRVINALATLNNKPLAKQLSLVNAGVNGYIDRNTGKSFAETTANIPKISNLLDQYGDDNGSIPLGRFSAVALKCGILLQLNTIDPAKLAFVDISEPNNVNLRTVVVYDDGLYTWVLDDLQDALWEIGSKPVNVSWGGVYRCDTYEAIQLRGGALPPPPQS